MDKSWINESRLSINYRLGVKNFLDFAFGKSMAEMMKCPCTRCSLAKSKSKEDIEGDLMCYGFLNSYTCWVLHGEEADVIENTVETPSHINTAHAEFTSTANLLDDLFPNVNVNAYESSGFPEQSMNMDGAAPSSENNEKGETFDDLLADFNQELYEGCTSFTKLSFILKLYHIKCMCVISDKGISLIIDLLKEAFAHAKLPASFSEMKKVIRKLGLTSESIHACPNNCMLYWEENANRENCIVCESSRWKTDPSSSSELTETRKKKKQLPAKVLRYFPLKPRLQRLFMSSKTASHMTWHASGTNNDGKMRHPRDGETWKAFDLQHPEFASDSRNVRLGLASDGFNPFGTMSTNYSIWPVVLFPYNFPPWMSMKHTSMILSMIIPGKQMPGNDIDVYLQPLIKDAAIISRSYGCRDTGLV